jgi:hypothetical protein
MQSRHKQRRIVLAITLILLGAQLLLSGSSLGLATAQAQTSMPRIDWQGLAQHVAMSLDQLGMAMGVPPQTRAAYVPGLTREYLQVFRGWLIQGATVQQADTMASQYLYGRISQLMAGAQSYSQRRPSLSERGMLFSTRDWIK